MWLQDGVAPQCPIDGIKGKRAFIPDNWKPQGFINSHKIKYYTWIFKKNEKQNGYVTPQK
jgi:hypothetical protein